MIRLALPYLTRYAQDDALWPWKPVSSGNADRAISALGFPGFSGPFCAVKIGSTASAQHLSVGCSD